jgi:hypothetical protein
MCRASALHIGGKSPEKEDTMTDTYKDLIAAADALAVSDGPCAVDFIPGFGFEKNRTSTLARCSGYPAHSARKQPSSCSPIMLIDYHLKPTWAIRG